METLSLISTRFVSTRSLPPITGTGAKYRYIDLKQSEPNGRNVSLCGAGAVGSSPPIFFFCGRSAIDEPFPDGGKLLADRTVDSDRGNARVHMLDG